MYTQGSNQAPAEIEMQKYPPANPTYTDSKPYQDPAKVEEEEREEPPSYSNYFLQFCVFCLAMGINVGMWAIDYFAVGAQASYFYSNAFKVSTYLDIASVVSTYTDSTQMFNNSSNGPGSPLGVAMSLIYSWVLWKFPLIVFTYKLVSKEESVKLRVGTWLTLIVVLLAFDILLTIFALSFYNDYIYFAAYTLFSGIVVLVNAKDRQRTLYNLLSPLIFIAFTYFSYAWLLPSLYKAYIQNLSTYGAIFLIMYGYPVVDLLFYAGYLVIGTKVDTWLKDFYGSLHFLLLGYGVGMIMLAGYTEVEFYYLIAYFIFRNIFVNHIMRGWEKVVANPPALPGWIACYYVSYAISFLPVIGVGKIVVARSFSSYIFAFASTILYGSSNPLYPSSTAPTASLSTNLTLSGNIYWLAALIIWVGLTFSQRYDRTKPTLYDLFSYLIGIHLFYLGITCSLSLPILYNYSTFN